jgi:hypothetical protein
MKKIKDLGYDDAFIERQKKLMQDEVRAALAARKSRIKLKGSAQGFKKAKKQPDRPAPSSEGRSSRVEKE